MKLLFGGLSLFCLALIAMPLPVLAAQSQDSVTVEAIVLGQPPNESPVIELPVAGATFQEKQIEVAGSCITSLVVKVFRNDVFAGSTLCQPDGTFSLQIDLVENKNDLVAKQYDLLSQPSPPSDTVAVFYSAMQPTFAPDETPQTARFQLIIDYDYNFQGVFVNEPFNLPIHFTGGSAPYAVSIDWGDDKPSVLSRKDSSQFFAEHTYDTAGPKTVVLRVSDSDGQEATLQFVLIVNGGTAATLPVNGGGTTNKSASQKEVLYSSLAAGVAGLTVGFVLNAAASAKGIKFFGGPKP